MRSARTSTFWCSTASYLPKTLTMLWSCLPVLKQLKPGVSSRYEMAICVRGQGSTH